MTAKKHRFHLDAKALFHFSVVLVSLTLANNGNAQIEELMDISGTWSQRPSTGSYIPTAPGDFPQNAEVYFDDQICVMRLGGLGTCGIAAWVYGRDWINLNRNGDVRTVSENDVEHFELDFTGTYHHEHSLPRQTFVTGGYWHNQASKAAWTLKNGEVLVYQLTGTLEYHPSSLNPMRFSLDGALEGDPPLTHGVEVGMGLQGDIITDVLQLGRQFREQKNVPEWPYPEGTFSGRDDGPFTSFFKTFEGDIDLSGRVFGRLSGLKATSGKVFVFGEDPETSLGSDELDEHGNFKIPGVPILLTEAGENSPPGVAGTHFTFKIDDALAEVPLEKQALFGGPIVYFHPGEVVAPPIFPVEIGLNSFAEPSIKRLIATNLSELSERHYKAAEAPVFPYLDAIGENEITDVEIEALRRGAWAERILLEAGLDAKIMITGMIGAISSLVGNLWDDFFDKKSDELKEMAQVNQQVEALEGATADNLELQTFLRFGLQEGEAGYEVALNEMLNGLAHEEVAEIAATVKAMFKGLKKNLSFSFEKAGIGPQEAQKLGDLLLWILDLTFRSGLAALQSQSFAGTLKPLGGDALKAAINATAPILFDNQPGETLALFPGSQGFADLFPSYTGMTAQDLKDSVTKMTRWQTADQTKYEQDAEMAALTLVAIQNEFTLVKQRVDFAATFTNIADASADVAKLAEKIPVLKAIFVLAKIIQYTSNACGIVEPMKFTFVYLPERVKFGVDTSYGKNPPDPSDLSIIDPLSLCSFAVDGLIGIVEFFDDKANEVLHGQSPGLHQMQVASIHVGNSAFAASILDAGDRYIEALGAVATELTAGRLFPASTATGASDGELAMAKQAWAELKAELTTKTSSAPTSAWPSVGNMVSEQLISDLVELTLQAGLREEISDLVIDVVLGGYTDPSEPEFIERSESIVLTIERLITEIVLQQDRLAMIEDALPETDAAIVVISVASLISTSTGRSYVSAQNEEFVISAQVRNIGTLPAQDISVALTSLYDETIISLLTSSEISVAGDVLEASDGVEGSGLDEITVEWTVRYNAAVGTLPILFDLVVLENGAPPLSFQTFDRIVELPIDFRMADGDSDGIADEFELAYGLNTDLDDSADDPDEDTLSNIEEYAYGTSPDLVDTDGDTIKDGDEAGTTFDPRVDDTESLRVLAGYPNIFADLIGTAEGIHPEIIITKNETGDFIVKVTIVATQNLEDWVPLDLTGAIIAGDTLTLVVPASESAEFLRILGFQGTSLGQADTDGDLIRDGDETGTTFDPGVDDTASLSILAAYPNIYKDLVEPAEGVHPEILISRSESDDFIVKLRIEASENMQDWDRLNLSGAVIEGDTMTLVVPASNIAKFLRILGSK